MQKQYKTEVRTDADYGDIPAEAVFSIGLQKAVEIARLAELARVNNLHCVERFDYAVEWIWGEGDDGSSDADRIIVTPDEFCFAAWVKHTNVEFRSTRQPISELLSFFGINRNDHTSPAENLVCMIADLKIWDWSTGKGELIEEVAPPSEGYQDSHICLMQLIERARDLHLAPASVESTGEPPALATGEPPALSLSQPGVSGHEYTMLAGQPCCWITVGNVSLCITNESDENHPDANGNAVRVEAYPLGAEEQLIEAMSVEQEDAECEFCEAHEIDIEDVAEWVGLHYKVNFYAESPAKRNEWLTRYLESVKTDTEESVTPA